MRNVARRGGRFRAGEWWGPGAVISRISVTGENCRRWAGRPGEGESGRRAKPMWTLARESDTPGVSYQQDNAIA